MILTIHVKPNARETKVIKRLDETTFVIAVSAPPIEGRANRALIEFLAAKLGIAKSMVEIVRGARIPLKHISVPTGTDLTKLL